jgi:hypothetical protein
MNYAVDSTFNYFAASGANCALQGALQLLHVVKDDYHGQIFEGNECKKVAVQNRDPNRDPKPQKVSIRDPGLLIETHVAALL